MRLRQKREGGWPRNWVALQYPGGGKGRYAGRNEHSQGKQFALSGESAEAPMMRIRGGCWPNGEGMTAATEKVDFEQNGTTGLGVEV